MTQPARSRPIFHLSFPVCDLDEALHFYTSMLPGVIGRRESTWADIALFGAQITLHHIPAEVLRPMPRSRHFGATLAWQEWELLVSGLTDFVDGPRVDYLGTDREQTKAMVQDPSGNLIEIKAYRNAGAVLGKIAEDANR